MTIRVRPYSCLRRAKWRLLTFATDVVKLVASILPVVALFQVFDSLSGVSGGILRARGKQVRFRTFPLARSRLDICGTVYRGAIEFKVRLPSCHISLAKGDPYLAPTMRSVSCPRCPRTSLALTDVLGRSSHRTLADVPTQHGAPWTVVWPDSISNIQRCSGRVARAEDGLELGGAEGAEAACGR
jgi:hypothetical protein